MFAQLVHFAGPRAAELIAAGDHAGIRRIVPALQADAEVRDALVATFVLRRPDGGEVVIVVAETEAALARGNRLIAEMPLLPDEDPALLPGPDRVETLPVVRAFGRRFTPIGAQS
jgi:hypothetical protein